MNAIQQPDYQVHYDPASATAVWSGSFRLHGPEYTPILHLMREATTNGHTAFTLDLRDVRFLNSAGINALYKLMVHLSKQKRIRVAIKGSARHPWQKKTLNNLLQLTPDVQLELT